MNENILKGQWDHFKEEIHRAWGKLTGEDLERVKGSLHELSALIQEKYGLTKEQVREKLDEIFRRKERHPTETDQFTGEPLDQNGDRI